MPSYSNFQRTNTFSLSFSTVIHFQTISSISVDFYIVSSNIIQGVIGVIYINFSNSLFRLI